MHSCNKLTWEKSVVAGDGLPIIKGEEDRGAADVDPAADPAVPVPQRRLMSCLAL